jgi:hypothetical protein
MVNVRLATRASQTVVSSKLRPKFVYNQVSHYL